MAMEGRFSYIKLMVFCALLSCLAFFSTARSAEVAPVVDVTKSLNEMYQGQKNAHAHLEIAKNLKSLSVFTCMDKKVQLIDRLVAVADRIANSQYKEAVQKKDSVAANKYAERLTTSSSSVTKLEPLVTQCWCEDQEAMNKFVLTAEAEVGQSLAKTCSERLERPGTVISLKTPEGDDELASLGQIDEEDFAANYGFPEIPAASPFR